ncbi:MAG: metal ABC transporter permease [Rikenellaceae bacterium]|nr:metal ABC transporter permease [Rikenellaceae bacterium]
MRSSGAAIYTYPTRLEVIDFISDISRFAFLQNALTASLLCGIVCGITGSYIVARRLVFLSGGITHASFGGIGMACYFGFDPLLGALLFSVASALGLERFIAAGKVREDSAIGVLWALGMAVGIVFIFLTPGYTPNLMSFLFGSILTITTPLLWWSAALAAVLVLLFGLWGRNIIFVAFDAGFAKTQKIRVAVVDAVMLAVVAASVVITIRLVGVMLLVSLFTIPPLVSASVARRFGHITAGAVAVAVTGLVTGLFVSYRTQLPPGASSVIVLVALYVMARLFKAAATRRRLRRADR